jgi:phosphohistidine phosphatase
MALTLLLLRHAKAKRAEDGEAEDFDRKLRRRGRAEAERIGHAMRQAELTPDIALVSASRRTRQTWEIVAQELSRAVPTEDSRGLYLAGPAKILGAVRRIPDEARSAVVVGHNPGIGALASRLAGKQLAFPTGALAIIELDAPRWREAAADAGRLVRYVEPGEV